MLNCNLFLWSKLYFQHHYCSLQSHMIFRNHYNMLLKKHLWLLSMFKTLIFLWKLMHFIFQDSQMNRKFKRAAFTFNNLILNMSLPSLLISLMHPWWINACITHTCSGTVALLVWRWARVSRSTNIRTPLQSIISFTFFCLNRNIKIIKAFPRHARLALYEEFY